LILIIHQTKNRSIRCWAKGLFTEIQNLQEWYMTVMHSQVITALFGGLCHQF